jgi:hypothetical protein
MLFGAFGGDFATFGPYTKHFRWDVAGLHFEVDSLAPHLGQLYVLLFMVI